MKGRTRLAAIGCASAALAAGTATSVTAAGSAEKQPTRDGASKGAELELVERPGTRFDRSLEVHRVEARYRSAHARARRSGVKPRRDLLGQDVVSTVELRAAARRLEREARRERREAAADGPESPDGGFGPVAAVSSATLESIAACESGGDPSAVNPAGYYGKYQFDTGTWASVGGSGNPAEASEAEQDYRASLLYSRAGASPWPVCGA